MHFSAMSRKEDRWAILIENAGSAHQGVVLGAFNVALDQIRWRKFSSKNKTIQSNNADGRRTIRSASQMSLGWMG